VDKGFTAIALQEGIVLNSAKFPVSVSERDSATKYAKKIDRYSAVRRKR